MIWSNKYYLSRKGLRVQERRRGWPGRQAGKAPHPSGWLPTRPRHGQTQLRGEELQARSPDRLAPQPVAPPTSLRGQGQNRQKEFLHLLCWTVHPSFSPSILSSAALVQTKGQREGINNKKSNETQKTNFSWRGVPLPRFLLSPVGRGETIGCITPEDPRCRSSFPKRNASVMLWTSRGQVPARWTAC